MTIPHRIRRLIFFPMMGAVASPILALFVWGVFSFIVWRILPFDTFLGWHTIRLGALAGFAGWLFLEAAILIDDAEHPEAAT